MKRVPLKDIQAFCDEVARRFRPEKIILFGSYAYGKPRPDSDVDLLVVLRFRGKAVYKAVEIRTTIRSPFALDLLARTPETIRKRLRRSDFFIKEILENGRVMYESSYRGMDRKSGR